MDVRYAPDPVAYRRMTTEELRKHFVIDTLFVPNTIAMVYSDVDRSITGSAVPLTAGLPLLATKKEMAAEYFLERREIGIINCGGAGSVRADGREFAMEHRDGLYIGRGTREVEFRSAGADAPSRFYFVSFPAHAAFPAAHTRFADVEKTALGGAHDANRRTISKYIHPKGIKSCQLVMGLTELEEGSVWNTMPVHTHQRRSEVYMYFNLKPDAVVFHILGEPTETRHLVLRSGQAVISPSWSIHSGVATGSYSFIWAMGGENQTFDDMDGVAMSTLS